MAIKNNIDLMYIRQIILCITNTSESIYINTVLSIIYIYIFIYQTTMEYQIKKTTKAFSVHTRRGKLLRVSKEQYLRTDLGCGTTCYNSPFHGIAQQIEAMPTPENHEYSSYLVLDTNVALQQMDLLELNVPPLSRIIILEIAFDELKNLNSTTLVDLNFIKAMKANYFFSKNII